ncbi:MAG: hypothetical protein GC178_09725 [Flavobacteriales bacterium]|nr:hypothetical protein [Flavobacteriales bacterium]
MRKLLILSFVLIGLQLETVSAANRSTEQIATFCKVWGFLKYYHPAVAHGKFDWDREFMDRVEQVAKLQDKAEVSAFYSEWIGSLGTVKDCRKCVNDLPDSCKRNLDIDWITDTALFSNDLIQVLTHIRDNRNQGRNRYVSKTPLIGNTSYRREKPYKDSVYPIKAMRLLSLVRYWNVINYFYPYKYLMDVPWDSTLTYMIPKFRDAANVMDYHLALWELTGRINDSHAFFDTPYASKYIGYQTPPFTYKVYDDRVVVNGVYNDSLTQLNGIQLGDEITDWDGKPIADLILARSRYVAASNHAIVLREMYDLLDGNTDSVEVIIEREGVQIRKRVARYFYNDLHYDWRKEDESKGDLYNVLEGNIGYMNLGKLKFWQVNHVFRKLKDTKALVIDVRNYPMGTMSGISRHLNTERLPFAFFTIPNLKYPGAFRYTKSDLTGHHNKHPYKGKVILLFNEETQSHGEFTLMALQTAPSVVGVGSQTAGADGNVSWVNFPGNYRAYFTGLGVYYPDGRETQRIGIVPDVVVNPTPKGIRDGRDEILEKALELLKEE